MQLTKLTVYKHEWSCANCREKGRNDGWFKISPKHFFHLFSCAMQMRTLIVIVSVIIKYICKRDLTSGIPNFCCQSLILWRAHCSPEPHLSELPLAWKNISLMRGVIPCLIKMFQGVHNRFILLLRNLIMQPAQLVSDHVVHPRVVCSRCQKLFSISHLNRMTPYARHLSHNTAKDPYKEMTMKRNSFHRTLNYIQTCKSYSKK